jgi:hypothetical protein
VVSFVHITWAGACRPPEVMEVELLHVLLLLLLLLLLLMDNLLLQHTQMLVLMRVWWYILRLVLK